MFEQSKTEPKEKEIKTTPLMLYRVCVCVCVCVCIGMMKIELVLNNLGSWKLRWNGRNSALKRRL